MAARARNDGTDWDTLLRVLGWGTISALLLAPLVAMEVTPEVNWTLSDFLFAAVILIGAGIACELVARRSRDLCYRLGGGAAIAAAVGLVWVTLAVGVIGSEDEPANLAYGGVILLALAASMLARFRPAGMAAAMLAAAVAQVAVGVAAVTAGIGWTDPSWPWDILGASAIFASLWLVSAGFFHLASRRG